jgi:hypothetical protein
LSCVDGEDKIRCYITTEEHDLIKCMGFYCINHRDDASAALVSHTGTEEMDVISQWKGREGVIHSRQGEAHL